MNCRYVESRLSCYLDGELTGREMLLIREHLASCRDCDQQVQEFASMKQMLGSLKMPPVRLAFEDELVGKVLGHSLPQPSLWDRICSITRGDGFSWALGAAGVIAAIAILITPEHQNLFTKGTSAPSPAAAMSVDQSRPYVLPPSDDNDMGNFQLDHNGSRDLTGPPIPLSFDTDTSGIGR